MRPGTVCVVGTAHFGPTLVSTTLAGVAAQNAQAVMLGELLVPATETGPAGELGKIDPWLKRRPASLASIRGWQRVPGTQRIKAPAGTQCAVLHLHQDVPAQRMSWAVARSHAVVVVVGPGLLARDLAVIQLEALARQPAVVAGRCRLAVLSVGQATASLGQRRAARWAHSQTGRFAGASYLGHIGDDPRYGAWHASGTQLFDYGPSHCANLLPQWQPLLQLCA